MRVTKTERTAGRPQLTPERVGGAEVFIGTVKAVTKQPSQLKKSDQYVIEFEEVDDAIYRLNVTGLNTVCEQLGDDTDKWVGDRVPLVKTRETLRNEPGRFFIVYQVAPAGDWSELLETPKPRARRSSR